MPAPRFRSRTLRRLQIKMPGGKTKRVYAARKPGPPQCAECGAVLKGIKRLSRMRSKNASKSSKRVSRPYGGFLCNSCARAKLKAAARATSLN